MASVGIYNFKTKVKDYFAKTLTFYEDDGSLRDFTNCSAVLNIYEAFSDNLLMSFSVGSGLVMGGINGTIDITAEGAQMDVPPGSYKYDLAVSYPGGVEPITEIEGAFIFTSEDGLIPIDEWVSIISPPNVVLDGAFITKRKMFWQTFLQYGPYPEIDTADLYKEEAWPLMFNVLIAMLIVKDYMDMLYKNAFAIGTNAQQGSSEETASTGNVKRIVTGPSEVEFHDGGKALDSLFKSTSTSLSAYQTLNQDICSMGSRLEVKLPGCTGNKIVRIFQKATANVTTADMLELVEKYF